MDELEQIPEEDIVDQALMGILNSELGDDPDDDDLDAASDILFDVVEELVDSDQIKEIPDNTAPEEEKAKWIAECLPIVKQSFADTLKELEGEEVEDGDTDSSE